MAGKLTIATNAIELLSEGKEHIRWQDVVPGHPWN